MQVKSIHHLQLEKEETHREEGTTGFQGGEPARKSREKKAPAQKTRLLVCKASPPGEPIHKEDAPYMPFLYICGGFGHAFCVAAHDRVHSPVGVGRK